MQSGYKSREAINTRRPLLARSVGPSACRPAGVSAGFCSSMTSAGSRALSDLCHGELSAGRSRQPREERRRCRRRINRETWERGVADAFQHAVAESGVSCRRGVRTGWCRAGLLEPPADNSATTRLHVNEYSIQITAVYVMEKYIYTVYIYNRSRETRTKCKPPRKG